MYTGILIWESPFTPKKLFKTKKNDNKNVALKFFNKTPFLKKCFMLNNVLKSHSPSKYSFLKWTIPDENIKSTIDSANKSY